MGRGLAQIDGDIEHRSRNHAHQFALGVCDLVMQAAQHALRGAAVVVLNELHVIQPGGCAEFPQVEALEEEAARIAKHLWLDDAYIRNGCVKHPHQYTVSCNRAFRYCP